MSNSLSKLAFEKALQNAKDLHTDLLEMSEHEGTCSLCKKYEGRVFSISGKDIRFPKLPSEVFKYGGLHEGCRHSFYPFIYGISRSNYGYDDIIKFSNRPFSDVDDKNDYKNTNFHTYTMEDYKNQIKQIEKSVNIDYDKINKQNQKLFKKM